MGLIMGLIIKLSDQIRKKAAQNRREDKNLIKIPGGRTTRNWPLCLTCGREVEAVEIKDVNNHSCQLWARCHGAEDWYTVDFGCRIEGDPFADDDSPANWAVKRAMNDFTPFDPHKLIYT